MSTFGTPFPFVSDILYVWFLMMITAAIPPTTTGQIPSDSSGGAAAGCNFSHERGKEMMMGMSALKKTAKDLGAYPLRLTFRPTVVCSHKPRMTDLHGHHCHGA